MPIQAPAQAVDRLVPPEEVIFGSSPAMQMVRRKLERISSTLVPVLITGESGTGKDILARLVHDISPWRNTPFVKVNCPAIPHTLLESELFGYERGAFTGANGMKPGRIETAHTGSLFLDEIGELGASVQAKLLQLLQDGQFCRLGGQSDRQVEVRVICATNRDLQEEVAMGNFRQDLYYRINVMDLRVPPLRERRGDIPMISNYFLRAYKEKFNSRAPEFSSRTMQLFEGYGWPGNIRELENLVKRYVILGSEDAVIPELLNHAEPTSEIDFDPDAPISLKKVTRRAVRELEKKIILRVLQAHHWNRKKAATALDISYRALLYKLKEAGCPPQRGSAIPALKSGVDEPVEVEVED